MRTTLETGLRTRIKNLRCFNYETGKAEANAKQEAFIDILAEHILELYDEGGLEDACIDEIIYAANYSDDREEIGGRAVIIGEQDGVVVWFE